MPHFVSPNTQHTLFKHQRDGWKPSGAPCLLPWKATEEGSQTHLPSSASIASIVAEEKKRGVAKWMREVSRGVHFVPGTSQWAAKTANADNKKVNVISTFVMTEDMWMLAKRGYGGRGRGEGWAFYIFDDSRSVKGRWHMFVAANLTERIASLRYFEEVWQGSGCSERH